MRALLDVNVLIALLDQAHPHHGIATAWLKANIRHGWASCPITQNGCIRIMSQPAYPGSRSPSAIIERLHEAQEHSAHLFWPDDVSILDSRTVDATRVHGTRQITVALNSAARSAPRGGVGSGVFIGRQINQRGRVQG